ncbi:Uncharacterised protein [Serratia quinivorans]|jgi:hypothetical protein|uniref:MrpH family fimbial adhesin n=1 Tax=Serratia quinivorans TaxID=137545 RepID=UPI002176F422|nr:hypothetical protein [Serratia quinivorans]CAI0788847.1 Uncharacterised protein [Serratia quinivorans]CAI0984831.1 Uncharacterised protein [Serratia quinivorans]CAI1731812.1 Uncharacterised protein [Serratia quinivorans]CAI1818400.1 Uncharacterised protein [Serratia quinivorans]CAI2056798.1 Uncharacterised protein [Serratia quinivorans]
MTISFFRKLATLFSAAFLLAVSGSAYSGAYLTTSSYESVTIDAIHYWAYGSYQWSSEESNSVICHRVGGCTVGICLWDLRPKIPSTGRSLTCTDYAEASVRDYTIVVPDGATVADVQAQWVAEKGASGNFRVYLGWFYPGKFEPAGNSCMGFLLWPLVGGVGSPNASLIAGQSCGILPPADLKCTTSGKVEIDYGTLEASKLNGATATTTFSLTCDRDATATIKLNDSVIDLGRKGDLTAAISIGGKDLATGSDVAVKNGTVTTTITSTLKAKGTPAVGPFEGSGVLIISYQ